MGFRDWGLKIGGFGFGVLDWGFQFGGLRLGVLGVLDFGVRDRGFEFGGSSVNPNPKKKPHTFWSGSTKMVGKKSMAFFLHGHNQSDGGSNAGTLFLRNLTKNFLRPFWSGWTILVEEKSMASKSGALFLTTPHKKKMSTILIGIDHFGRAGPIWSGPTKLVGRGKGALGYSPFIL